MAAMLTFHVPPDAHPEVVEAIFHVLTAQSEGAVAPAALREQVADMLGRPPRSEALALVRDLALVAQTPRAMTLTPRGAAVAASAEAPDLIHGLSYFAWSDAAPEHLSRLWTYRTVVDLLWELAPVVVDAALKKRLVEDVLARAEEVFATADGYQAARTSVGPKSVDGVLRWLERINPAVLRDRQLQRRQRCAPLLMALALSATVTRAGADPGADFRLGPEERGVVSRACFLEPAALDAMLEWTMQTQPQYVRWGTPNARYGRQVMLVRAWPA
jgi:hypothetical protein